MLTGENLLSVRRLVMMMKSAPTWRCVWDKYEAEAAVGASCAAQGGTTGRQGGAQQCYRVCKAMQAAWRAWHFLKVKAGGAVWGPPEAYSVRQQTGKVVLSSRSCMVHSAAVELNDLGFDTAALPACLPAILQTARQTAVHSQGS
jgi:hypothetical protein